MLRGEEGPGGMQRFLNAFYGIYCVLGMRLLAVKRTCQMANRYEYAIRNKHDREPITKFWR